MCTYEFIIVAWQSLFILFIFLNLLFLLMIFLKQEVQIYLVLEKKMRLVDPHPPEYENIVFSSSNRSLSLAH